MNARLWLVAAAVAAAGPAGAEPDFAEIDSWVEKQRRAAHVPGMALVVVHQDEVVHTSGFGIAGPSGREVTAETPFILGSTSKSFTALAILQLVEEGRLKLDAPVQSYLPWFRVQDEEASKAITLRHLLNHTSGLPTSAGFQPMFNADLAPGALERGVRALAAAPLNRPVGGAYEYCNANYNTLGLVVEVASGMSYGEYIQRRIFDPLEMKRSFVSLKSAEEAGLASGHRTIFGINSAAPDIPYPPSFLPAGFLVSTAEDIGHYLVAQMREGRYRDATVLSPDGIRTMHAPAAAIRADRGISYGMGWVTRKPNEFPVLWHNGDTGHYHTEFMFTADGEWGVALLANGSSFTSAQRFDEIVVGVLSDAVGKPRRNDAKIHRILFGIYSAFFVIPLLQFVALRSAFAKLRRWKRDPDRRPKSIRGWSWHVVLPLVLNVLLAVGLVVVTPQLFGGAAPLSEIVYVGPDMGLGILLSVLAAAGWVMRTGAVVRWTRSAA